VRVCDKCGRELRRELRFPPEPKHADNLIAELLWTAGCHVDLCDACLEELRKLVKPEVSEAKRKIREWLEGKCFPF